jgi:TatD DNase family protein
MATHKIVDTHTHIGDASFDIDRGEVLERAADAGIGAVIAVGENMDDARRNIELADRYPIIRPAAGLYPTILDPDQAEHMHAFIRRERHRLVAIGEVGLDFWVVKEEPQKELQKEILKGFINLSRELDLPLNIHSRSAGRHAVALLLENGATRVQMHAFDGKASAALPAVEAGFFFSIPPSVVRSRQKQKLVKHLPLSCLLVETDSPVLGPDPKQRNEPANITQAIKAIMELKSLGEEEVLEAVGANSRRLYGNIVFGSKNDSQ